MGLEIPHSVKRFPGYDNEEKKLEAEEAFKRQFSRFIKLGVTADSMEGLYKKAHAAIRSDPAHKPSGKKDVPHRRWNAKKIGLAARKAKVAKAKEEFLSQIE